MFLPGSVPNFAFAGVLPVPAEPSKPRCLRFCSSLTFRLDFSSPGGAGPDPALFPALAATPAVTLVLREGTGVGQAGSWPCPPSLREPAGPVPNFVALSLVQPPGCPKDAGSWCRSLGLLGLLSTSFWGARIPFRVGCRARGMLGPPGRGEGRGKNNPLGWLRSLWLPAIYSPSRGKRRQEPAWLRAAFDPFTTDGGGAGTFPCCGTLGKGGIAVGSCSGAGLSISRAGGGGKSWCGGRASTLLLLIQRL